MRFIKRNQQYKTSGMQPILPLVPERLELDKKDKTTFITFDLKVCAGTGAGTPSYKKHIRTFDKGTPQEWMESLNGLREIWQQNSVNGAHDCAVTVAAVLKGDSRIAFEAAIEDARTDPNAAALIPLTADHVEESLFAVTTIVFPFRALETQKQWMNKYMKKPFDLSAKMMSTALSRINNYLPSFPDRTERNADQARPRRRQQQQQESQENQICKIRKKKSGNKTVPNDGQYYCKKCGTNSTHDSEHCYFLKRLAREANNNDNGKAHAKPYSKRTFRKEVNSMACRAGKHNGLKIVESALKREQGKLEKQAGRASNKKHAKKAAAKKSSNDDSSSDESMHNMEARIPWKKQYSKKYASRTLRFNSNGKVLAEESEPDNNRKMPAKLSEKKAKKNLTKNLFLLIQWTLLWMNLIKRKRTVPIKKKKLFSSLLKNRKSPLSRIQLTMSLNEKYPWNKMIVQL
jgi:hypothetical protein